MLDFGNVLIIGAHYDDSELGAGGTAARLIREGRSEERRVGKECAI